MGTHGTHSAIGGGAGDARSTLAGGSRRVLACVDAHAARADAARGGETGAPASGSTGAHASGSKGAPDPGSTGAAALPVPGTAPLDALVACFGLTAFERDLVLLTAAQELEPTAGARCAAACGDPERAHPTFSLALAALADPHWSALTPVAPLRRWRIVEPDDASGLTTSRLRL